MNNQNKEKIIDDYIGSIDWNGDDWDLNKIKQNLKSIIGQEPAIKINYKKESKLNEMTQEVDYTDQEYIKSVQVYFVNERNEPKNLYYETN